MEAKKCDGRGIENSRQEAGKGATELKKALTDAARREQARKAAAARVEQLKAELAMKTAELKQKSTELSRLAKETATHSKKRNGTGSSNLLSSTNEALRTAGPVPVTPRMIKAILGTNPAVQQLMRVLERRKIPRSVRRLSWCSLFGSNTLCAGSERYGKMSGFSRNTARSRVGAIGEFKFLKHKGRAVFVDYVPAPVAKADSRNRSPLLMLRVT